jgi:predicted acetyltransferase
MEIGPALDSDHPELIDMVCLAFRPSLRARFSAQVHEDCTYQLHQSRVGKADGKIVSYARVADRPIRVGGCVVKMGGIGAVSTHPDYRGHGYNTLVLQDAIRYMEEQKYDVSMLFTGISGHYGKLGWVTFPEHSISVAPVTEPGTTGQRAQPPFRLSKAASRKDPCTVRPFDEPRDLDAVIRIYHEHNRERTGTAIRTPDYWRCGHSRFMGVLPHFVVERGRRLVAYIKCGASEQTVNVPEVGYLPEHPGAVASMARFLVQYAIEKGASQIDFRLGRLHPLPEILCEMSNGRMSHSEGEGMMLRVINLPSLFRKVAPDLRRRLKAAGFHSLKASIAFAVNGQTATLKLEDGAVTVEDGDHARVKLSLDGRTFFRMLMGNATFRQMSDLNQVRRTEVSERTASLLDALFPPGDLVYWGCDHF